MKKNLGNFLKKTFAGTLAILFVSETSGQSLAADTAPSRNTIDKEVKTFQETGSSSRLKELLNRYFSAMTNLIAHWSFNDLLDGKFKNQVSSSFNGVLAGNAKVSNSGIIGKCLKFESDATYSDAGFVQNGGNGSNLLGGAEKFSVSFWYKQTEDAQALYDGYAEADEPASSGTFSITYGTIFQIRDLLEVYTYTNSTSKKNTMYLYGQCENYQYVYANHQVVKELGKWYHFAATYDNQYLKLYLNGQQVVSQSYAGRKLSNSDSYSMPIIIGGLNKVGKDRTLFIDEVKIAPYAFTPEQILKEFDDNKVDDYSISVMLGTQVKTPPSKFLMSDTILQSFQQSESN